jgi:hypothetical protein
MENTKSVRVCVLKETCNVRVFQPCLHIRDDFLRTENTSSAAVLCAFIAIYLDSGAIECAAF